MKHPSQPLLDVCLATGYQGCRPSRARCILVGYDSNFPDGPQGLLAECIAYVDNPQQWWQNHPHRHHPLDATGFQHRVRDLLEACSNEGLPLETLRDGLCFLELLGIPTKGSSTGFRELYGAFLFSQNNRRHLLSVRRWMTKKNGPLVILPKGVLELMGAIPVALNRRDPRFFQAFWQVVVDAYEHFQIPANDIYHHANVLVTRKFPYRNGQNYNLLAPIIQAAFH